MKIHLVGRNAEDLRESADRHGLEIVGAHGAPDVVITYGGDGTLIGAEKSWPGVPKVGLRDRRTAAKCEHHRSDKVLARLAAGDLERTELDKLAAYAGGDTFVGMNDILLRNQDLRAAVRFIVHVNDVAITDEIIGDGLVASTPFGSSAYFRSITYVTFHSGIGIAFNNCTDFDNHFVLGEDDDIRVQIIRGPAEVTADNDADSATVRDGDDIHIARATDRAVIYGVDALRCSRCRYTNAPRRRF